MPIADQVFPQIVASTDGPVRYRLHEGLIGMEKHFHPLSISPFEFDYLEGFISRHELRRGYEVATAFGVSALAMGHGLKATGGKLVTMDAYVEEQYDNWEAYRSKPAEVHPNSDGYRSATFLLKKYGLENHVFPTVGWSPNDTERNLRTVFALESEPLDFAFIDGGHFPGQVIQDVESIRPFLGPRFAIFLHDNYPNIIDAAVHAHLAKVFPGLALKIVVPHGMGRNLSLLTNLFR